MGQVYYIKDIKKINSSKFGSVKIDGKIIKGEAARNYVAGLVKGGKEIGSIERKLEKAGLRNDQWGKRKNYLKVISGGLSGSKKNDGLTPEQEAIKARNLQLGMQRDEITREEYKTKFARGGILTKSIGVAEVKKEKGTMGKIGINSGSVRFAGQTNKPTIGINH